MTSIWIVVPAFNEAATIREALAGLRTLSCDIVLVDDCSTDSTALLARAVGTCVLRHPVNLGQGAALQTGITFALNKSATHIVTFDADLQHRVRDIPLLLNALSEANADFALGSRFLGSAPNIDRLRKLVLKAAVWFTRLTTGLEVTDAHNGIRAMTRRGACSLNIRHNRMAHGSEILHQIAKSRLPYLEVPVVIEYTPYSKAKGQKLSNSVSIILELLSGALQR